MKKIYCFMLFQVLLSQVFGQNFEGKIVYKLTFTDSSDNYNLSTIEQQYFKDSNFKVVSTDPVYEWALYINAENKYYTKLVNSDTIQWTDGTLNHDSVISMHINKHVLKVLGYDCDELIMVCNTGIRKYYYSTANFKIDARQFIRYKAGNWTDFLLMTNSLPLMQIEDSRNSHTLIIAIAAKEMKLDQTFFQLPENPILLKSSY